MSADSSDPRLIGELDESVVQLLIERCGLSADSVQQIINTMRRTHMGFAESALHTGLAPPEVLEVAISILGRRAEPEGPGIIETVLRRQAQFRRPALPAITARASRRLCIAHAPEHAHSEAIRALRTQLLLLQEPSHRATMMALLSPSAGEGRSQLAAELAIAFSQLGQPTLLVDADLRKPSQHVLFDTDNSQGLSAALADGVSPQMAGVEGFPNLTVLAAGPPVPNPLELLSSGHFEEMAAAWRQNYQFVLVDTPPIADFADGIMTATLMGRVLVLSRANVSTHRSMKDMLRRLASTQARVLGSVINRF